MSRGIHIFLSNTDELKDRNSQADSPVYQQRDITFSDLGPGAGYLIFDSGVYTV
jgi:hypothetical protein